MEILRKQSTARRTELFSKKAPPQMLNQQSESAFSDNLTSLLIMLMLNALIRLNAYCYVNYTSIMQISQEQNVLKDHFLDTCQYAFK